MQGITKGGIALLVLGGLLLSTFGCEVASRSTDTPPHEHVNAVGRLTSLIRDSVVNETSSCVPADGARYLRIELGGLVDLVARRPDRAPDGGWQELEESERAVILLPDTKNGKLNTPSRLPYARHEADLSYLEEWEHQAAPDLGARCIDRDASTGDCTMKAVSLDDWHVTLVRPTASALRLARHPLTDRDVPRGTEACSLEWVPTIDDMVGGWSVNGKLFDSALLGPTLPAPSKVTSRLELSSGFLFTGSFHGVQGMYCQIDLGGAKTAVAKSMALAVALPAESPEVVLSFRSLREPGDDHRLVLEPTEADLKRDDFEMQIFVNQKPAFSPRKDFVAHYGLRVQPPKTPDLFPMPSGCGTTRRPIIVSLDPQCSPGEHDYP